jgi:Holliday junction resolvase
MLSRLGIPDIIGVINGQFFALELKVGKNKATALQTHVLKKITEAGGFAQVVIPENLELTLEQLRRYLHEE